MRKKVVTIGNSAGITISPAELAGLGVVPGDEVEVSVRGGVLEARPVNRYAEASLDELMAVIDARRTRT